MATNNKSIPIGSIYACSLFYHMEKVLIGIFKSPIKWRDNRQCYTPSFKVIGLFVVEKKIFKVFTIYGQGSNLGHVAQLICINFHSHPPISFHLFFFQMTENNEVSRVEETTKKTRDVGNLQEGEQELENFQVQSTEDKELEEDTSILNQDLKSANQATEIGRILIL